MVNLKAAYLEQRYEKVLRLNTDNKATTWLVRDNVYNTLAVKKYMPPAMAPLYHTLQELKHRNLVPIYQVWETGSACVVIEAFTGGESLAVKLAREGVLSGETAADYLNQLCNVLYFLHEKQIIHRDITPHNVLISPDGVLKLIDFDISRIQRENKPQDTTILGTVGYAAPEQFGFRQTDNRSDIYAAGVLFNFMLTGMLPSGKLCSEPAYRKIILKCTSMDPSDRYANVWQLQKDLARKTGLEGPFIPYKEEDVPVPAVVRAIRKVPGFRTGRPWKALVGSICYLLMIIITYLLLYNSKKALHNYCLNIAALFLLLYLPYYLVTDLGGLDAHTAPFKYLTKGQAFGIRILFAVLSMFFGLFAFGFASEL